MSRKCFCNNVPKPGQQYVVGEHCHPCYLWNTNENYRKKHSEHTSSKPHNSGRVNIGTCKHLGKFTGKSEPCPSCNNTIHEKVYECSIHKQCTLDKLISGLECCKICNDKEILPSPDILPGIPDPIPELETTANKAEWACNSEVRDRHILAFRKLLNETNFPPPEKAVGDGIIIIGGGKYWPSIVLSIKLAREVTNLPIQVWHRGEDEPIDITDIEGIPDVEIKDASKVRPIPRVLRGWECKTIGLIHCGFRRVLLLDADAYLISNPIKLFNLASQHNFVYWRDLPSHDVATGWHWFGVDPMIGQQIPPIQGGHLFIDRLNFWREICLAHWWNQHSDYSYHFTPGEWNYNWHGYGDQAQWRVVLAATGKNYLCLGRANWIHPAFICTHEREGIVVHRCQGKIWGEGEDTVTVHLPKDKQLFQYLNEYLAKHSNSAEEVFTRIYQTNKWGPMQSSGTGSMEAEGRPYIDFINGLAKLAKIEKVIDLGCGDGWIATKLKIPVITGVDIYRNHVEKLNNYFSKEILAICMDLDKDRENLPIGHIALMKDILNHWPNALIKDWITWAKNSGKWKYIPCTQDRQQQIDGQDTILGNHRGLNIKMEPLKGLNFLPFGSYLHKDILLLDCEKK